jgi:hypothetical protein
VKQFLAKKTFYLPEPIYFCKFRQSAAKITEYDKEQITYKKKQLKEEKGTSKTIGMLRLRMSISIIACKGNSRSSSYMPDKPYPFDQDDWGGLLHI